MFVCRVNFKNGLLHEYNYGDPARGEEARRILAAAMLAGDKCEIWDDSGRQSNIDGAEIVAVQMVDVQLEIVGGVRLMLFTAEVQKRLGVNAPAAQGSVQAPGYDDRAPMDEAPIERAPRPVGIGGFSA